jgi:REP element-mobilizing transposase RayT
MAGPLRVNVADGWYHCMHRGIERRLIFCDDVDCRHFLSLLGDMVDRYRVRVHAYCLLGNHYQAIIQTPDANLSKGMQWLGLSYSSWFNARYNRAGPLFQGRFRSVPVEAGGVDESRLEKFRDVVGIGSAEFIDRMKHAAGVGDRETERRGRLRERVSFEQVCRRRHGHEALRQTAEEGQVTQENLPFGQTNVRCLDPYPCQ